jgi:ring-1,2-phenylacetyl-CoA epoxidase subunit PaaE
MLKFHSLKVAQVSPDAEDAVAIALEVPEALRAEYRGSPGQHVVVRATVDGEDIRRTYSLVNAPGEVPLRIVPRVHAQGRMSRHLAEGLRAGDLLEVLPPNGSFIPRELSPGAATFVAFAAGCGITPVLAVVRALLAGGAGRVLVFYGNTGSARAMCLE